MALARCPECGKDVPERAFMCPFCGFGLEEENGPEIYTQRERRENRRIKKRIMLKINNELGLLSDISREGIRLSTAKVPSSPGVDIKLKLDEQTFHLKGTIRWQGKERTLSNMQEIGVSIDEAPPEYYRFVDSLYKKESKPLGDTIDEEEESDLDKFFQT